MFDASHIHVELFHGLDGLHRLAKDWIALTNRMDHIRFWHLHPWHLCCVEALENNPSMMSFAAMYERGELQVILPMRAVPRKIMGFKSQIHQLTAHPEIPFCDLIPASQENCDAKILWRLLEGLRREHGFRCDVLRFPLIPANSNAASIASAWPRGLVIHGPPTQADFIELKPYDELLEALSKNFRANLRKARNKLEVLSGVSFHTARTEAELLAAFEEFLLVEASGWKGSHGKGTAVSANPQLRKFLTLLIQRFAPLKACEINVLRQDERALAAQLVLIWGDTYYLLKIGYDQEFASLAPGNMLLEHVLKRFDRDPRIRRVHLISNTKWHEDWNCKQETILHAHVFNSTLAGRRGYWGMRLERLLGQS